MGAPVASRTTRRYREGTRRAVGAARQRARHPASTRAIVGRSAGGADFQRGGDPSHHGGMRSAPHGTASATGSNRKAGTIFDRRSNAGTAGITDARGLSDSFAVR